jgi:CMP-N,N'-diacetyllegionaminic acid synthase
MNKTFLGIIPARGGSKGIPDKNIRIICGKPLIAYTIDVAKKSKLLSDVIVSTDSDRIAKEAFRNGIDVPALRPAELATDTATTLEVVKYEVEKYESLHKIIIDCIVILQPTCPLRTESDIDCSIDLFNKNPQAQSLISCCEANNVHPKVMYKKGTNGLIPYLGHNYIGERRQNFDNIFIRNGAIYICTKSLAFEKNILVNYETLGYVMPKERSVNIDDMVDLELAEFYLKRREISI